MNVVFMGRVWAQKDCDTENTWEKSDYVEMMAHTRMAYPQAEAYHDTRN